jgi:hypothetical protein
MGQLIKDTEITDDATTTLYARIVINGELTKLNNMKYSWKILEKDDTTPKELVNKDGESSMGDTIEVKLKEIQDAEVWFEATLGNGES